MRKMSQKNRTGIPVMEEPSFQTIVSHVAAILLGYKGNGTSGKRRLSQREMASLIGTSWEQINGSLRYLQEEGAIKIDHHRIIGKEALLQPIAGGHFQ